jgi:hypothetical protein
LVPITDVILFDEFSSEFNLLAKKLGIERLSLEAFSISRLILDHLKNQVVSLSYLNVNQTRNRGLPNG